MKMRKERMPMMLTTLLLVSEVLAQTQCGSKDKPCYVMEATQTANPYWGLNPGDIFLVNGLEVRCRPSVACPVPAVLAPADGKDIGWRVLGFAMALGLMLFGGGYTMSRLDKIVGAWRRSEVGVPWKLIALAMVPTFTLGGSLVALGLSRFIMLFTSKPALDTLDEITAGSMGTGMFLGLVSGAFVCVDLWVKGRK